MKKIVLSLTAILSASFLFSQEALKSTEEEYYDFLSLQGIVERPTLGYRTLSDSEWKFIEKEVDVVDEDGNPLTDEAGNKLTNLVMPDHPWQKNNLGTKRTLWQGKNQGKNCFTRGFDHSLKLKIYGPEWYNSFNTAAPYGQNDGALWQGKGYNSSLTGGARLEAYGFELTLKPQVSFSQNLSFDYITPNYSGDNYAGKAEKYGYYGVTSVDAPQRFGDSAFWNYDWGDSEIRWTWKTFTTGFGTQAIWLGPARLNPIIHSNNAPSYPKFDIGLRKTAIYMPHFGWNLGDFEARAWWGILNESDYFDNNNSNNNNLLSAITVQYQLPHFKTLTIGLNYASLEKFNSFSFKQLFTSMMPWNYGTSTTRGNWDSDKRMSFNIDYISTKIGFETYLEWGINDHPSSILKFFHYPFHTSAYTLGFIKTINITNNLKGEIIIELSNLESSNDYGRTVKWSSSFYTHDQITQGYTNKGQWLGAGIGTGGNSQYLGFKLYYPKGTSSIYLQRRNQDLDYNWFVANEQLSQIIIGASTTNFLNRNFYGYLTLNGVIMNSEDTNGGPDNDTGSFNLLVQLGLKYNL